MADFVHDDDDPRWRALTGRPGLAERLARQRTSLAVAGELSALRAEAGLGVRALARAAGWDPGFVARLESGLGGVPTPATVARYAAACGAVAGYVFESAAGRQTVTFGEEVAAPSGPAIVEPSNPVRRGRSTPVRPAARPAGRRAVAKT